METTEELAIKLLSDWEYEMEYQGLSENEQKRFIDDLVLNGKWTCTDPDNNQYMRKVKEGIYEFKEANRFNNDEGNIIYMTINLSHYSNEKIWEYVQAYGLFTDVHDMTIFASEETMAECIFEQKSGLY